MSNLRTLYLADNRIEELKPLAGLKKIWSLDVSGNQVASLQPVSGMKWLTTLNFSRNRVDSLEPLTNLRALDMLIFPGNPVQSLQPLVRHCQSDTEHRFAPYLDVYLSTKQLARSDWADAIATLRSLGVSIRAMESSGGD